MRTSLLTALIVALMAPACDTSPATQFTVGVTSQIIVPNDVQSVRIIATTGGNIAFCQTYPVVDGKARLPQSLALAPGQSSDPNINVTVSVMGFTVSSQRVLDEPSFDQCTVPTVSPSDKATDDVNVDGNISPQARVLRRSTQPYIVHRNLYLPMPLHYSCFGVSCSADQTCKGGQCTSPLVDPKLLPEFDPLFLSGSSSSCFDSVQCLGDAVGPDVVDATTCTYEVPTGTSLADVGLNVRAIYEPYRVEVLDQDPVEGFTLPDPTGHPNRFRLAPGLCSGGQGPKIKSIVASRTCAPKNVFQPLCATDATTTTLAPAPSLIYLLVDQDTSMLDYIGTKNAGSTSTDKSGALDDALALALGDPVFMTTQLAFRFVPSPGSECAPAGYATPDGSKVQPFITIDQGIGQLTSYVGDTLPTPTSGLALNALLSATGVYGLQVPNDPKTSQPFVYNRKAIVLATNRTLDPADSSNCAGAGAASAVQAAKTAGFDTYVFSLRNALETPPAAQVRIDAAAAFATASGAHVTNAEGGAAGDANIAKLQAAQGVGDLVASLGACLYDKPHNFIDPAQGKLTLLPAGFAPIQIPVDATCNATSSTADGWAIDGPHIRVCGSSCTTIRSAIAQNELLTAQRNQSSAALPGQVLVQLTVP